MLKSPPMVDMRLTPEEQREDSGSMAYGITPPEYPYGLSLCLDDKCLEKLEVDTESLAIGQTYHLFVMAKVTSISKDENSKGSRERVELQITHLGAESEDEENAASEEKEPTSRKMYKK